MCYFLKCEAPPANRDTIYCDYHRPENVAKRRKARFAAAAGVPANKDAAEVRIKFADVWPNVRIEMIAPGMYRATVRKQ